MLKKKFRKLQRTVSRGVCIWLLNVTNRATIKLKEFEGEKLKIF